jgi:hypothetical protein
VPVNPIQRSITQRYGDIQGLKFGREQRYFCAECHDGGWVKIFRPEVIEKAIVDPDLVEIWATCLTVCSCKIRPEGQEQDFPLEFREGPRAGKPIPVFGEAWWHINANHPDAKAQAAMLEKPKPEGYVEEFAEYDQPA